MNERAYLQDLGSGLILRKATLADIDSLAEFNGQIQSDDGPEQPDQRVSAWARDLVEGLHPNFKAGDFTIVEEVSSGRIISSLCLISQTWRYEGIPFGVGRPELVGTLPQFRGRGLIRAQFEVAHQWSADRGERLQAITGIPYYYRQFGYEMALNLSGGRSGFAPQIPKLKDGEEEPYRVRPAVDADLGFIADLNEQSSRRYPVSCMWDLPLLRYELQGKSALNVNRLELRMIEDPSGEPVGFLGHPGYLWGTMQAAQLYEVKPGLSWAAVTPTVIRYLEKTGCSYAEEKQKGLFEGFAFWLGEDHPVYHVIPDRLPRVRRPYAWYVRVPDLPGFLRHIRASLEQRLANSPMIGHSGELKITFYRSGLRLVFEGGSLARVEPWKPEPVWGSGDAGFPDLTFLQLLFGYRSLEELKYAFADCWTKNDEVSVLLDILFPRRPSNLWGVS